MAQTILSKLSIELSKLAGDQVTEYRADGDSIYAYKREAAINIAVGKIYEMKLKEFENIEKFIDKFPMYNGKKIYSITDQVPNSLALEKTDDIKLIKDCYINSIEPEITNRQAGKLTSETYTEALTNKFSLRKPSTKQPKFYETEEFIEIHFTELNSDNRQIRNGTVNFTAYLKPPKIQFSLTGEDILMPFEWFDDVLSLSYEILMNTNQG